MNAWDDPEGGFFPDEDLPGEEVQPLVFGKEIFLHIGGDNAE